MVLGSAVVALVSAMTALFYAGHRLITGDVRTALDGPQQKLSRNRALGPTRRTEPDRRWGSGENDLDPIPIT